MTRRIIIIIASALGILALMFALWFWFFSRGGSEETLGEFGTGGERGQVSSADGNGNTQTAIGGAGSEGRDAASVELDLAGDVSLPGARIPSGSRSGGGSGGSSGATSPNLNVNPYYGTYEPPGAIWLDGSYTPPNYTPPSRSGGSSGGGGVTLPGGPNLGGGGEGGGGGGSRVAFDPTPINRVENVTLRGTPYFDFEEEVKDEEGLGLALGLGGVAGACALEFLGHRTLAEITTAIKKVINGVVDGIIGDIPFLGGFSTENVYDAQNDTNQITTNVVDCMVSALGKAALRQITAHTVNWINSGFEGKPAYVQNFRKFFADVADQTAGEFIQGSAFSFLCSPFQLEVRVAIAASYAQRNVSSAQACTLSGAVGNVEEFLEGNFSEGGWRGLISFTHEPSNNPFGAYLTAQARLNNQILADTAEADRKISIGGFLSKEECVTDQDTGEKICQITTPGTTVEATLQQTLNLNLESFQVAESIDDILSALQNQLITKVLYEGLGSLSRDERLQDTRTPEEKQATKKAQALLTDLRKATRHSEQYGAMKRGSIRDIQNVQESLTDLQNCWTNKGRPALAAAVEEKRRKLEEQVTLLNKQITAANEATARAQELHTELFNAASLADVERVEEKLKNRIANGRIFSQDEEDQASLDRKTLQRQMDNMEQEVAAELNQCNASTI